MPRYCSRMRPVREAGSGPAPCLRKDGAYNTVLFASFWKRLPTRLRATERVKKAVAMAKVKVATVLAAVALAAGVASGALPDRATPAGSDTVVLDTFSIWRIHCSLKPPLLETTGKPAVLRTGWLNVETPPPAAGWTPPEFDDRFWHRGPAGLAAKTPLLARVCLRGKFTVTDPTAVKSLRLSATYRGGLVVYLNGKEVHREHIAEGAAVADGPGGEERTAAACPIPLKLLRTGLNVLAVEGIRAPYPASDAQEGQEEYRINTCEVRRVRLTASDSSGLIPNAARPEGLQVWNADAMASDFNLDFGDQAEPLYPVTIMGARNGAFSGKLVVGSTEPIRGLNVTPGSLQGKGGSIPASNVRIRYALPWGGHLMTDVIRFGIRTQESAYPTYATLLSALAEEPLEEFPVMPPKRNARHWCKDFPKDPGGPAVVPGAVVPVWITVEVPPGAEAGTYTGTVRIMASGQEPVDVPVELRVADYTLPDTQGYRTFVDMIQSPDTLALEYDLPLWSDAHFDMIGESFKLIAQTGSRTVYIPLIAHTSLGNEESMVRWIEKQDGYEYDFSVMEKYLDAAEQNMGKPELLVFVVWEVYMLPTEENKREGLGRAYYLRDKLSGGHAGKGPLVTVWNPATEKAENAFLPPHSDAASMSSWKPLFDGLRERLRRRGLEGTMMLGIASDMWPAPEDIALFHGAAGDVPWVIHSHSGYPRAISRGQRLHGKARFGYQAFMYGLKGSVWPPLHGWQREHLVTRFDRRELDRFASTAWRHLVEPMIAGDQRGVGRLGADYWQAVKDKRGRRAGRAQDRYPESHIQKLGINASALAPGPTGPVATQRFEALREGLQECEARIAIERALADGALRADLGEDLARRCEEHLQARSMMIMRLSLSNLQLYSRSGSREPKDWMAMACVGSWPSVSGHNWFLSSGWQERTWQLFSLAGEVAKNLEGK